MLHMLHGGVARVARRIGAWELAWLCYVACVACRIGPFGGLAWLCYVAHVACGMSIIVALGSQAVSVHLRHPMLFA